ncbi:hypothetical protein PHYC_01200 [Phycisphaerales bacterium]|nr:hypothetical protein PHYC_01200 [Phycisphaerales bacterium]
MFARYATTAIVVTLGASLAAMAPEPDPIPRRWQLAVETGPLRVASIQIPGEITRAYYFLTYKVTNTTDQDLLFTPSFELGTDEGEVLRSGRGVPTQVTRDILERLNSPFIQDQTSIVGVLPQGEANAKEGVVIWPINDLHVNEVTIYGAGFSGETRAVEYKNAKGENEKALLRKTLMLRYQTPGEIRDMAGRSIELADKQWIMR